jgi:lipopolysaccharide biosynthesis glycosyltransferase
MKWYFSLNEAGTKGCVATHTRVAVLSALQNTRLVPHLIYDGVRNEFIDWLAEHGVKICSSQVSFKREMERLSTAGKCDMRFLGHWGRTAIQSIETEDSLVLYTDIDVAFFRTPSIGNLRPKIFSAAPEFKIDEWNYFNSGVMVMNVDELRSTYKDFEKFIIDGISAGNGFLDQNAYNIFYRGKWNRLPQRLNWKPYWGVSKDAEIVHFHGPKFDNLYHLLTGAWPWTSDHDRFLVSLFHTQVAGYIYFVEAALNAARGLPQQDIDLLSTILEKARVYRDDDFMPSLGNLDFKMFPD